MRKIKNKLFYVYTGILYIILFFAFLLMSLLFLENIATKFLMSTAAANKNGSDHIIEIVIDDYSIQKYQWPWSMDKFADMIDFLQKYSNPSVIGLDINISSFNSKNPKNKRFIEQLSKNKNVVLGFVPESIKEGEDEHTLKTFRKKYPVNLKNESQYSIEKKYNGVFIQSDDLMDYVNNFGSVKINVVSGSDSLMTALNILNIDNFYYPSLALKMYMIENDTNNIIVKDNYFLIPKTGLRVPYYNYEGEIQNFIRYYRIREDNGKISDYTHNSVSASVVLDTYYALNSGITPKTHPELFDINKGKYINPEFFKGKAAFIGANFSGPSEDVQRTPILPRQPGVDIQATMYDNFLGENFLSTLPIKYTLFALIFLSMLSFILIMKNSFIVGIMSVALLDIFYVFLVFWAAGKGYLTTCYASPLVCQFLTTIFAYSFKFITENRNKEKIKQAMGKYISKDVMQNVVNNIDDLKLGGKRAVVTVLFSDIRGFTSLSEKMPAEEVSMILNEYFGEMEPIISKYNGVINKFIGDAVMAIFGEPIPDSNHPQNAVRCAYEMLKKVEYLREKWLFEGKPRIEIGVGINTGEVFIGNIGTEQRMEYTVIGDTVNLASRIEGYNKVYKTNLLVSSSTYSYISDIADVIKINEVQIRGKSKKMNIYEVLRLVKETKND